MVVQLRGFRSVYRSKPRLRGNAFFSSSMHPSPLSLTDRKVSRQTLLESVRINRGESQALAYLLVVPFQPASIFRHLCVCVCVCTCPPSPEDPLFFSSRRYLSSHLERGEPIVSRVFLNCEKLKFEDLRWNANESGKSCFASRTLFREDFYLKLDYLNERSEYLNEN